MKKNLKKLTYILCKWNTEVILKNSEIKYFVIQIINIKIKYVMKNFSFPWIFVLEGSKVRF